MKKEEWEKLVGRKLTEEEHRKLEEILDYEGNEADAAGIVFLFKNKREWFEIIHREAEKLRDIRRIRRSAIDIMSITTKIAMMDVKKAVIQIMDKNKLRKAAEEAEKLREVMNEIYSEAARAREEIKRMEEAEKTYWREEE